MAAPTPHPVPASTTASTPVSGMEPGQQSGRRLGRGSAFAAVPGSPRHQAQTIEVVRRYSTGGESIREIAAVTGMSYGKVHKLLTQSGVTLRRCGPRGPRTPRVGNGAAGDTAGTAPQRLRRGPS